MHPVRIKPTTEELKAAYGPWGGGVLQGEAAYKLAFPRWPMLAKHGIIRFRGGSVRLTHRGYRLLYPIQLAESEEAIRRIQQRRRQRRQS